MRKFMTCTAFAVSFATVFHATPTHANDPKSDIREAIECRPAKGLIKFLSKFDRLKPKLRDSVDAVVVSNFTITDDGQMPDRLFMRADGQDHPFTIAPDGTVQDLRKITQYAKQSELCVEDQARAGLPNDKDGMSFNVDVEVRYVSADGTHTLEELIDGAKDGKSIYGKMVPAPIRLVMPKMTHLALTYDDATTSPDVRAFKGDVELSPLPIEAFDKSWMVSLKHLEDQDADRLIIAGGPYRLEPSPSIEKLKDLGFIEDDKDPPVNDN